MYYRDFAELKKCSPDLILSSIHKKKINGTKGNIETIKLLREGAKQVYKRCKIQTWFVIMDEVAKLFRKPKKLPEGWALKSELEKEYDQRYFASFHYNCQLGSIKAKKTTKYESGGCPVWMVELDSWKEFVNGIHYIPDVMGNLDSYWAEERKRESLNNYR